MTIKTNTAFFKTPVYMLQVLFFLIPFGGKLASIGVLLLIAWSLFCTKKEGWLSRFKRGKPYLFPSLVYFLVLSAGLFLSDSFSSAMNQLVQRSSFLIFPLVIPLYFLNSKQVLLVFRSFVLACLLIVIASLIDFAYVSLTESEYIILGEKIEGNRPGTMYEYLSSHFLIVGVHRTYFSVYLLISILFIAYNFRDYNKLVKIKSKWFGFASLIILVLGLIFLQSKAGLLSLILISIFILITKSNKSYKSFFLAISTLLVIFFLSRNVIYNRVKPMINEVENIISPGNDSEKQYAKVLRPGSTEVRYMLYKSSYQLIKEAPIVGYGLGDVKDVVKQQNYKNEFLSIAHLNYGPHSQILWTWISSGIIGVFVLIAMFLFPFINGFKNRNYFIMGVILVIFFNCFTESFLSRQDGIILTALFITFFSQMTNENRIKNKESGASPTKKRVNFV